MAWFKRSGQDQAAAPATPARAAVPPEVVTPTRAFPKFLQVLSQRESPVIVDFGPVIGGNVSFFGERLSCKIYVEDLFADIERHARANKRDELPAFFANRLTHEGNSVDGLLLWDLFDFLDRASTVTLAAKIAHLVRPGGAVFGYFGAGAAELSHYSKFVIQGEAEFRVRPYPATPARRQVLLNRDVIKMFEPLTVAESTLLKSNTRETLFRKS